jgi:hypothetical protein
MNVALYPLFGLLLKLAMMERLAEAEPQVRLLFTMNTETNEHMVAINETLGYRVLGKPARSWELPADRAAARRWDGSPMGRLADGTAQS